MEKFPRKVEEITHQIDLAAKLRDIKEYADLEEALYWNWWEVFLLSGLFAFSLGLVSSFGIFVNKVEMEPPLVTWFLFFWTFGFVMMSVLILEFLTRKYRALRRLSQRTNKRLEKIEKELENLKRRSQPKPESSTGE